ncbi:hypothetical protein [Vibrio phage J14]|nr:hypothetical protein [Vibrio phage J14]
MPPRRSVYYGHNNPGLIWYVRLNKYKPPITGVFLLFAQLMAQCDKYYKKQCALFLTIIKGLTNEFI